MGIQTMLTTHEKVARLLNYALGEPYGDGEIVTDVISGYAEPGYGSYLTDEVPVIVLGNWNTKRSTYRAEQDGNPLTPAESLPERLARSLERMGAEIQWLDEWARCCECGRAIRTEPDSYSWKPSYLLHDDFTCHECALEGGEDYLEEYVNNPRTAVTWCDGAHLEQFGYDKWGGTYENGWYPGQTDDPEAIHGEILKYYPEAEVIFLVDSTGQFDMHFSAYVRRNEDNDDE